MLTTSNGAEAKGIRVFLSTYRGFALVVAALQITLIGFPPAYSRPGWLIIGVATIYTLYKVSRPVPFYIKNVFTNIDMGIDLILSVALPPVTGSLQSPFLPYCLSPMLTSGLLFSQRLTLSIAGLSPASLILSQVMVERNFPSIITNSGGLVFSILGIYIAVSFLIAWLPYMININISQDIKQQATAQERKRLSHEMHDGMSQSLEIIRWKMESLRQYMAAGNLSSALSEVDEIQDMLSKTEREARQTITELRTSPHEFVPTLAEYAAEFTRNSGITCELHTADSELKLPLDVGQELLQIAREALTNIRKHADASKIEVELKAQQGIIDMIIRDNGKGFSPQVESTRHGLVIMAERARRLGGKLEVNSSESTGTEVKVHIRLPPVKDLDEEKEKPKSHLVQS